MLGQTISHYRAIEKLGGDMGVVYKAEGTRRHRVSDVSSTAPFSPDGKRMAYQRTIPDKGEDQLLVANRDGSSAQVIMRVPLNSGFTTNPSWPASGKKFAITRARYHDADVVMFSGFR
jgi:Tol biopolymer transport system component